MARPKLPARARRVAINLTMSRETKRALERAARAEGVSASQLVERLVLEHIHNTIVAPLRGGS